MPICIWGTSNRETIIDAEGFVMECPECISTTRMIGKSMVPYCSVFYIPLFPEGKGEPFFQCTHCGAMFAGDTRQIKSETMNRQQEMHSEIETTRLAYEEDRSNTQAGKNLVELLFSSGKEDEGLAFAARLAQDHPNDPAVQVLLARIHIHRGEMDKAFGPLRKATDIDPTHAEAHYYAAVAMMNADSPRVEEALEIARLAKDYGHPEAEELIEAIEHEKQADR